MCSYQTEPPSGAPWKGQEARHPQTPVETRAEWRCRIRLDGRRIPQVTLWP